MPSIPNTIAVFIESDSKNAHEIESLVTHMLNEHDETPESLRELVEDFMERHPDMSLFDAIDAVHTFQTDAAEMGDWDAWHTH